MRKQRTAVDAMRKIVAVWLVVVIIAVIGWVKNIIKLAEADFESPYKTEVIRTISIVPPIGAFTGWMDIGEENED